jgi:hypothetical protein
MSILRREVKAWLGCLLLAVALTSTNASAAVPQKLKDGLKSDSTKVRVIAIAGIARNGDAEARGLLQGMLGDKEPSVRAAAVDGLALLKDPAALPSLLPLKKDADEAVRAVVGRAIDALEALLVHVDVGDVEDLSKSGIAGLLPLLQSGVERELKAQLPSLDVRRGGVTRGYGLVLKIRSVTRSMQDGNGVLEVKCDLTLVELPGKILRLSSSATAAAGVDGEIPKAMEKELATDAINACAPSLANDFIEYAQQRIRK